MKEHVSFVGKMLIAMPGMDDPRFAHAVIYMCAHSSDGGMGLIINKPQPDVQFSDLLDQLGVKKAEGVRDIRVHFGGPVDRARGFVLHTGDYAAPAGTLQVDDTLSMSATMDVIEDIAQGVGPENSMLALGYTGWGPGQLETEIAHNGWLTCDPNRDIIFGRANEHKWTAALRQMGIDPVRLSSSAGRA